MTVRIGNCMQHADTVMNALGNEHDCYAIVVLEICNYRGVIHIFISIYFLCHLLCYMYMYSIYVRALYF